MNKITILENERPFNKYFLIKNKQRIILFSVYFAVFLFIFTRINLNQRGVFFSMREKIKTYRPFNATTLSKYK